MQKTFILIIIILIILLTPVFENEGENIPNPKIIMNNSNKENDYACHLWTDTISVYLQDELWTEQSAYDAGHCLSCSFFIE